MLYPKINWRYSIVYLRIPNGPTLYYRGGHRRGLFITSTEYRPSCWTTEISHARLFEEEIDLSIDRIFQKSVRGDLNFRKLINWRPYHEEVLKSHLILPPTRKRKPPG